MIAEGADAAALTRSIPIEKCLDDAMLVYSGNGERLRPEQGYPLRLLVPGFEGNMNVKWLRRIHVNSEPVYSREETSKYTDLLANGKARQFTFYMEAKSIITRPSGTQKIEKGFNEITGVAWSGHGKIQRVDISTDNGVNWQPAYLQEPILTKALTRFRYPWKWDGEPHGDHEPGYGRNRICAAELCRPDQGARSEFVLSRQCDPALGNGRRDRGGHQWQRLSSMLQALPSSRWLASRSVHAQERYGIGHVATPAEIAGWNIDVNGSTGKNLPAGSGSVQRGQMIFDRRCAACHGAKGEGGIGDRLVGGEGTLASANPIRTVGQLLGIRSDAVRLHPVRDADERTGVVDQR